MSIWQEQGVEIATPIAVSGIVIGYVTQIASDTISIRWTYDGYYTNEIQLDNDVYTNHMMRPATQEDILRDRIAALKKELDEARKDRLTEDDKADLELMRMIRERLGR